MAEVNLWTREETLIALYVYCRVPFKECRASHPVVQEYAKLLDGRTPAALNRKIGNIGRLDLSLKAKGITGLTHGAHLEEDIWNEFMADPEKIAYESEQVIASRRHQDIEISANIFTEDLPEGNERDVLARQRIGQQFFRDAVLVAYSNRCCVTGITNPLLVEACHISSWADDAKNRTNPKNGLCLNPLFHKAFDKWLFAVSPDYEIDISDKFMESVSDDSFRKFLDDVNHKKIILPHKFLPDNNLLAQHYETYRNSN